MSTTPNCPCDACSFPAVISNPPGLSAIQYRAGDFTSFRDAMLHALPDEVELANWKPTSTSDLALQMIEWWAYLADILTFYNQRIANQDYLRTADLDASVNRLIRVLGFRPRPGIGAQATLAALVSAKQPITLPQGFAVQSKPGPGQTPQIFELSQDTQAQPGGDVSADPDNSQAQLGADGTVLLKGTITSIKAGDLVLLAPNGWNGTESNYMLANVQSLQPQVSPRGTKFTQAVFSGQVPQPLPVPSGAVASGYRLLRSTQNARLFQYGVDSSLSLFVNFDGTTGTADLDSVTRQIKPGDLILFDAAGSQTGGPVAGPPIPARKYFPEHYPVEEPILLENSGAILDQSLSVRAVQDSVRAARQAAPAVHPAAAALRASDVVGQAGGGAEAVSQGQVSAGRFQGNAQAASASAIPPFQLAVVDTYTELIWYANNPTAPATSPGSNGIPVLHSEIVFTPYVTASSSANALVIRYGWQDVGVLMAPPATSFDGTAELVAVTPPSFASGPLTALLEDSKGNGASVSGMVNSVTPEDLQLTLPSSVPLNPALTPPIDVLTNLLPFTRGKTVANEVLGSGDATVAGQEFTLAKSPLTYLLSPNSASGSNYSSTLHVWVNSVEWTEQPSFYGQPPTAAIFVTREDENNVTHVQFGDGVNGARLPTGSGNVIASYRYGSGESSPGAGTLTVVTTPQTGLAAIENPVAAGGGADPEPSSQIRKYAPLSVLAFDRAISGDDYEAIAASTPGVDRASAVWSFDPLAQRTVVTVYVGDSPSAVTAAELALRSDADPNRPINVQQAQPIALTISLTVTVDPAFVLDTVAAAAVTALTDPDTGLFGANRIGIGEAVFKSQIYAACLSVPGAVAVHSLSVTGALPGPCYRFDPGEGFFFTLDPAPPALTVTPEVANA